MWLRIRSLEANETTELNPQIAQAAPAPVKTGPEEGQIVDAQTPVTASDTAAQPNATRTSGTASAREQRYRELLQSAPPPSSAQPAAEPSLMQRVVNPIADALGIKRETPPRTAPGVRPRPQQQAQQPQQPSQQEQPGKQPGSTDQPQDPNAQRDEDSDVAPPRLLAAEFVPPQVQDGEFTTLGVTVADDLSGVRSVSGVVASPSGAQQGFACQREGESGRFSTRINVPKDAAEGVWVVRYLTLTDNASNSVNLNTAQGTLPPTMSFRVVSAGSDSKGPILKAVWLDQTSMSAGEKNQVSVTAEDDKSGVSLVSGVFVSPSKQARIGFGCRQQGGDAWQCPVSPPSCVDCGSWQLEQLQLQDKANNMTTVRMDNPLVSAVRLDLHGKDCDSTPPVLTALSVQPPVVSNADASVIRITAVATDDQCGVASLSGQALPPGGAGGSRLYFPFKPSGDGQTFVGDILVPKHAASGVWTIAWIQALDKGHNLKAYSAQDPVVARVTFRVE